MGAVWMWLRVRARRQWRAWAGLALIAGLPGGAATAAAAGARRADTAYVRLLEWSGASDISTGGTSGSDETFAQEIALIEQHPLVEKSSRVYSATFAVEAADGRPVPFPQLVPLVVPPAVRDPYRAKLLRGRTARPDHPDEATISFAAEGSGLKIGDTVHLLFIDFAGAQPREVRAPVRIEGIHAAGGDFPSVSGSSFPVLSLTPAFFTKYREYIPDDSSHLGLDIWIRGGAARVDEFIRDVSRRGIHVEFPITIAEHTAGVRRSMRFESGALWLLGALIGAAGLAITGQAIGRQIHAEADESSTARALGMSTGQLFRAALVRAAFVGVAAGLVGTLIASLLSPLTPLGLSRIAEPEPGFRLDAVALALGALATAVLVVIVQIPYALAASRPPSQETALRSSRFASLLSRLGAPPSAVAGAVLGARGRSMPGAAATRAAVLASALGVGALVMALVFAGSMHQLLRDPRLSGFVWDALVAGDVSLDQLRTDPRVDAYSEGGVAKVEVDGRRTVALALEEAGPLRPVIAEGRSPRGSKEIALGSKAMRNLNAGIGSSVTVARVLDEGEPEQATRTAIVMQVVGRVVVPSFIFQSNEPGEGVMITTEAALALGTPEVRDQGAYMVRFRPGTDIDRALADESGVAANAYSLARQRPADLDSLEGIVDLPIALAAVVAAIGAAALAHALVQTVRRRRRDLAILRSIGFVRRQVRSVVAWQTSTIVCAAMIVGIPSGLIAGRWGWRLFADQIAVLPSSRVDALAVALIVPGTIALANLVATVPARAAARTQPAVVLRTE